MEYLKKARELLDEYYEKLDEIRRKWPSYRSEIIENLTKAIKEMAGKLGEDQLLKLSNIGEIKFPSLTKIEPYVTSNGKVIFGDAILDLKGWLNEYLPKQQIQVS